MQPILKYRISNISYGTQRVLNDVSFDLFEGEVLGIVGESGSGKSTLIHSILGILDQKQAQVEGKIIFEDKDLLTLSSQAIRQVRGHHISMVFQDTEQSFCAVRTIGSQIIEAVQAHHQDSVDDIKRRTLEMFENVGLSNPQRVFDSYPFELSGGMNQRVGVCLAMLLQPQILLADEPTSALDVTVQKEVIKEMMMLKETLKTSLILVSHDFGVIQAMADRVLVMKSGTIVESGRTQDIMNHPQHEYTKALIEAIPILRRHT